MGAGNVAVGVTDNEDLVGEQIGQPGLAFGEGLAGDIIAIGGVAAKGAEFKLIPELIMAELDLRAFGVIAGEEGEGGGGWMVLAVVYEFTDAGQGIVLTCREKGVEALKVAGLEAGNLFLGWLDGLGGKDFAD